MNTRKKLEWNLFHCYASYGSQIKYEIKTVIVANNKAKSQAIEPEEELTLSIDIFFLKVFTVGFIKISLKSKNSTL